METELKSMGQESYALISVCRNEEAYIDGLVQSVAGQTRRPLQWVIVDDGSTDETYSKIVEWSRKFSFIKPAKMPGSRSRSFSSKVFALQHGWEVIRTLDFDYIGFLDADVRVNPGYYARIIKCFENDRQLGLAGGMVIDEYPDRRENVRKGSEDFHVAGGVQFFRRKCFQEIGGYVPVEAGGEDTIADVMVAMRGWKVQTLFDLEAVHLRPDGYGKKSVFQWGMRWGRRFYMIGYHPLYYFAQCARRVGRRPVVVGSLCQLTGFIWASLRRETRPVSPEFVKYHRRVQLQRLGKFFAGASGRKAAAPAAGARLG